jgi:hypothetical protein
VGSREVTTSRHARYLVMPEEQLIGDDPADLPPAPNNTTFMPSSLSPRTDRGYFESICCVSLERRPAQRYQRSAIFVNEALSHYMVTSTEPTPNKRARRASAHPDCAVRGVLDRIGDKWNYLLILNLASGPQRFGRLRAEIDDISQRMLTETLRSLQRDGLVERESSRRRLQVWSIVSARLDARSLRRCAH